MLAAGKRMNLVFIGVVAGTAALSWWLSGYDARVTGEDKGADLRRRALRCGVTLLLAVVSFASPWIFLAATLLIAVTWAGCLSELFAGGFHRLLEAQDTRPMDPKQSERDLNQLAMLVQSGLNEAAIELCKKLRESGEASALAIEAVLFQVYSRMFASDGTRVSPPLAEAARLRKEGKPDEAAAQLESILQKEPENLGAAFLLMRIYAQDSKRPDKADALLRTVGQLPHVPPNFVEYARRTLHEWSGVTPPREETTEGIESLLAERGTSAATERAVEPGKASVDELLAGGHLATAVEILEGQIQEQPEDFGLWLKLAEAHGFYCGNFNIAGKIIGRIGANPAFAPEQVELAKAKLKEWRES